MSLLYAVADPVPLGHFGSSHQCVANKEARIGHCVGSNLHELGAYPVHCCCCAPSYSLALGPVWPGARGVDLWPLLRLLRLVDLWVWALLRLFHFQEPTQAHGPGLSIQPQARVNWLYGVVVSLRCRAGHYHGLAGRDELHGLEDAVWTRFLRQLGSPPSVRVLAMVPASVLQRTIFQPAVPFGSPLLLTAPIPLRGRPV